MTHSNKEEQRGSGGLTAGVDAQAENMGVASGMKAAGVWNSCASDKLLSAGDISWLLMAGEAVPRGSLDPAANVRKLLLHLLSDN